MPSVGRSIAQVNQNYDEYVHVRSEQGQFSSLKEAQEKSAQVAASDTEDAIIVEKDGKYHVYGIDEVGTLDPDGNSAGEYELHDFEANIVGFDVTKRDQKGLRLGGEVQAVTRLSSAKLKFDTTPETLTANPQQANQQENNRNVAANVTREVVDLGLWSSNKLELTAVPALVGVPSSRAYTGSGYTHRDMREIREIAQNARNTGYGNCRENACVAAEKLADQGVSMVELYAKENHAFVVIGRDPASNSDDPSTWGPNAYVVDPWQGRSYQATSENISTFMFDGETPDVWSSVQVTDAQGKICCHGHR